MLPLLVTFCSELGKTSSPNVGSGSEPPRSKIGRENTGSNPNSSRDARSVISAPCARVPAGGASP